MLEKVLLTEGYSDQGKIVLNSILFGSSLIESDVFQRNVYAIHVLSAFVHISNNNLIILSGIIEQSTQGHM